MSIASKIKKPRQESELPITPMIDIVFLLLMYFMLSSTIQKQEADLIFSLPGTVVQSEPLEMPDEQVIVIMDNGQAVLNDFAYDFPEAKIYSDLAATLSRYQEASQANLTEAKIVLKPSGEARHESIIKVMDACSMAGIGDISFSD
ncbi:biopolymer transporter ExbD [Puniceicoccaceae bacterium K14]|nr:biopolymer transporter ExbD [Puniceicoccaceae bacterium K14]